jgi:hypothetical protein
MRRVTLDKDVKSVIPSLRKRVRHVARAKQTNKRTHA